MRSTCGWRGRFRPSTSSVSLTIQSSIAGAKRRREQYWRASGVGLQSAVWNFIQRRPRSSTARMTTGRGSTIRSSSTSWDIRSSLDARGNRWGGYFVSFLPAISTKSAQAIRKTIREWRMASTRNNQQLEDLARLMNPVVRGWMNYYERFYRSKCVQVLRHINEALARWARRKYKRFKRRERASMHFLGSIARRDPNLFVLW